MFKKLCATMRLWYYRELSGNYNILYGKPLLHQPLLIEGNGRIQIGHNVHLGYELSPGFWNGYIYMDLRGEGALIELGDNVTINNDASLTADGASIRIGHKTVAGVHLSIETSDGHTLHPDKRNNGEFPRKSVTIGENVFIGDRVTILKGVTIGDNSVIGAIPL